MAQLESISVTGSGPAPNLDLDMLNRGLAAHDALGTLRAARLAMGNNLAVVSSFGADSAVLLHMVAQVDAQLPVLFLQTGKHFDQTLSYVEALRDTLGLADVRLIQPDPAEVQRLDPEGTLWQSDPDHCCRLRKTEPLDIALASFGGWVTGRKRYDTDARRKMAHFERASDGRIRVNPLADWSSQEIAAYKADHNLPAHPLVAKGYASIGCAPCTSAVAAHEHPRAGRWRGTGKTECGIHFDGLAQPAAPGADVFRDGRWLADPWRSWQEGDDPAIVRYTHIPVNVYRENRAAFAANPHPLGLFLAPDDEVGDVAEDIARFSSISVTFQAFTDGRGYSLARLLVERFGYAGELRAVGDVLSDQIPFMLRCGFNAFVVSDRATRKALESGQKRGLTVFLQPVGATNEVPLGTRPFLRRAAN